MADSLGKRLAQARLKRGLTLEEAAHSTKMRPDKILALEAGDFTRFGNNAYAKGFLQIYGRFLKVDVSAKVSELETPTTVSIDDYQYLSKAPTPEKQRVYRANVRRSSSRSGRPSATPLFIFGGVLAVGLLIFWVSVTTQRLGLSGTQAAKEGASSPTDHAQTAVATTDERASTAGVAVLKAAPLVQPDATLNGKPALSDGIGGPVNEIVIEALKNTWVKVRKGTPDSAPIFEDYLYARVPPLKLRGNRFFIEVRDESAVQIRKNGNPIAYQAPGISIQ